MSNQFLSDLLDLKIIHHENITMSVIRVSYVDEQDKIMLLDVNLYQLASIAKLKAFNELGTAISSCITFDETKTKTVWIAEILNEELIYEASTEPEAVLSAYKYLKDKNIN